MYLSMQCLFGTVDIADQVTPAESYRRASREAAKLHVEFLKDTYAQPVLAEKGHVEELSALNLRMHNHFVGYGGKFTPSHSLHFRC